MMVEVEVVKGNYLKITIMCIFAGSIDTKCCNDGKDARHDQEWQSLAAGGRRSTVHGPLTAHRSSLPHGVDENVVYRLILVTLFSRHYHIQSLHSMLLSTDFLLEVLDF